ncbi:MAG: GGDEF domain-containing phosphodiesterase [Lachnospiraceae bacterium]|nr:GGDEF domain-containing phosphodiesterase [Lachnospiraceae bacterium]
MAGKNKKRVKELKKSYTWIWLIVFVLLIIISCVMVSVFALVYGSSFVSGKLDGERSIVENMASVYEAGVKRGDDTSETLSAFKRGYLILDGERNIVYSESADTCGALKDREEADNREYMSVEIGAFVYDADVYPDTEYPVIRQEDDEVTVDILHILQNTDSYIVESERDMFTEDELNDAELLEEIGFINESRERKMMIPLWMGLKLSDGRSEFIAKSYISVEVSDLVLLITVIAGVFLLVLASYVVMIINIISGISRRRKTLRVFFTDAVTQGHNYMYFLYEGEELIKKYRNRGVNYHVVDLDFVGYRNFCVCHSAEEGERVTTRIYQEIRDKMDRRKEICAHVGGESFALLLRDGDKETVRSRIQSIMDIVSHVTDDHVFVFQAGIETLEADANAAERKYIDMGEVYNKACAARESLNSDDPGIAFFDKKLIEDRRWEDNVQEHQQAALINEEFVVYYQPKYDPRTDELRGAEALIRWQSPDFGFVPPGRMIPIFEKNGFITEIDHYMVSHVARDQKRWLDAGFKCVPVSVNISRAHFIESDLAEQIRDLVDAEGTPHELLEIELTESAFFDDKKAMINTIEKLKSYGFAVSMDDFGSGYSSLNSLKDMPLDVLKLDAEFFRGETDGNRGEIVVSEAIQLAKKLNMRTVAEGVEIRDQVDFLATQGCDMIQGYFYAKPMPGEEYEVRMNERYKPKE